MRFSISIFVARLVESSRAICSCLVVLGLRPSPQVCDHSKASASSRLLEAMLGLCFYTGMDAGGTATTGCPPKRRGSEWKHESPRLLVEERVKIGALSCLVVTILERIAAGLEGVLLRTEIYSIHGFSHVFFGIGLASAVLFLRPRSSARLVVLAVLVAGIAWELYEGLWLSGEPLDSVEDVMLSILSASTFLCLTKRIDRETSH